MTKFLSHNKTIFQFEERFDIAAHWKWFENHWQLSFVYVALYLIFIFGGRSVMKNKAQFDLRRVVILWNFLLALFSVLGTLRVMPELWHSLTGENHGSFYNAVCSVSTYDENKVYGYWTWAFVMSKVVELFDTALIVLRKKPLIFLHWYHHATVLLYTWHAIAYRSGPNRWYSGVNFLIHSFMYSYYCLHALGFRIPKAFAAALTTAQILQMVVGMTVTLAAYYFNQSGYECPISRESMIAAILLYGSYLVLFTHFFYTKYLRKYSFSRKLNDTFHDSGLKKIL